MPLPALAAAALDSPVIGGIVNGISSIFTNKSNADINREQREWQAQQNDLQRNWQAGENSLDRGQQNYWNQKSLDWQEKMWNLQNQYNTPSAMMQRYKEANLNPYLAQATGNAVGSAPASSAGSPSISSSPAGSPSGMGSAPNAIPMQSPRFDVLDALGVSASVANQHAQTLKTKWQIYEDILDKGDRQTAKRFLSANPDMMSDSDFENNKYMRSFRLAETRQVLENDNAQWEFDLKRLYGVKQAELELNKLKNESDSLLSLITQRGVQNKEIEAKIRHINAQIKTEKTIQARNLSEADLASAKAQTENESRMYVIRQLLLNTNILDFDEQQARSVFQSQSALRGWLTSQEGQNAIAESKRILGLRQSDALWSAVMQLLGSVSLGAHMSN